MKAGEDALRNGASKDLKFNLKCAKLIISIAERITDRETD